MPRRRNPLAYPLFSAAVLCLALLGCGGDLNSLIGSRSVTLNSRQVTVPNTSSATATATVTVSADRQTITVITQTTGLTNITAAHIHAGLTGTNGLMGYDAPIVFTLFDSAQGSSNGMITRVLTSVDFTAQASTGISTFADAVNAVLAGRAYIDFHTTAFPNGEIRGQIVPNSFTAQLTGASEVPANDLTATGTATVTIDPASCTITVNGATNGFTNSTVTAGDIHVAAATASGPIIFPLFDATQGPFAGTFNRTLTATDLVVQTGAGVKTCNDAINAILTGNAYINIKTLANPTGAIRGQLVAVVNP